MTEMRLHWVITETTHTLYVRVTKGDQVRAVLIGSLEARNGKLYHSRVIGNAYRYSVKGAPSLGYLLCNLESCASYLQINEPWRFYIR